MYDDYLAAFTQFEVEFLPETPPASTARHRRELDMAEAVFDSADLSDC